MRNDFSLTRNLAAEQPAKLRQMQALFMKEAQKYHVLPAGLTSGVGWRAAGPQHIVTRALLTDLACSVVRLESFELAGLRGWPAIVLYAKVSTSS